jgi:hypothetical protein
MSVGRTRTLQRTGAMRFSLWVTGFTALSASADARCQRRSLSLVVGRDMKLHSILLGWTGFLTRPCVSPQVFHGSTRLSGRGRVATTARGVEPSRKCSKPGSLKPGAS